jgi:hypothetical protein
MYRRSDARTCSFLSQSIVALRRTTATRLCAMTFSVSPPSSRTAESFWQTAVNGRQRGAGFDGWRHIGVIDRAADRVIPDARPTRNSRSAVAVRRCGNSPLQVAAGGSFLTGRPLRWKLPGAPAGQHPGLPGPARPRERPAGRPPRRTRPGHRHQGRDPGRAAERLRYRRRPAASDQRRHPAAPRAPLLTPPGPVMHPGSAIRPPA